MAREAKRSREWQEVIGPSGVILGRYAVEDGMIIVEKEGRQKRTHASPVTNDGLARLMLSEKFD